MPTISSGMAVPLADYSQETERNAQDWAAGMLEAEQRRASARSVLPLQRGTISNSQFAMTNEQVYGPNATPPEFHTAWSMPDESGKLQPNEQFTGSTWGQSHTNAPPSPAGLNMGRSQS